MKHFNLFAMKFLTEIYSLENKPLPTVSNNDELLNLYSKKMLELNDKLLQHRQNPMDAEFLAALKKMAFLPNSTRIIIDSFSE